MNITSFYLSYLFLIFFVISFLFFVYFKMITIKSDSSKKSSKKIVGNMKSPSTWKRKNNTLSYICAFWSVLSLILFIYLKFFYSAGLINLTYFFVYMIIAILSVLFIGLKKKHTKQV